jgi:DeoR family deoxyribose operon repressor
MAKKTNRLKEILNILNKHGEVTVKDLARYLFTSEMTIRRDLNDLEGEGIIRRTHGGAILTDSYHYNEKTHYLIGKEIEKNVNQKSIIGFKAASLINNGEAVGFDLGTTIPFIAKYLDRAIQITAICVTFECVMELYNKKNVNLLISGGYLHRDSDVFSSDEGIELLKKIRTDKVFLSAGGIDAKLGLTCYHDFHVEIKKILMKSSKKTILVSDSSKFGNVKPSYFADLRDIQALITDENIPDQYKELITGMGIELIIAKLG